MNKMYSIIQFMVVFLFIYFIPSIGKAEDAQTTIHTFSIESAVPDSGLLSTLAKGYRIASNLSLDNVGEMAEIILKNPKKSMDGIISDVGTYLNKLDSTKNRLQNIKINKNTRIYVKRVK